jgi:5-bromo-4-chloroindolyl phosphate hydrolysis protein
MLNSKAFYPFAILWYSLSNILGRIVSSILLTAVYFTVLMPVAMIQKLAGKDKLYIKQFKKTSESAFITRNHLYKKSDLENPY